MLRNYKTVISATRGRTLALSCRDLVCSQQQLNDVDGIEQNAEECFVQYQPWRKDDEIPLTNMRSITTTWLTDSSTRARPRKPVGFAKNSFELAEKATPGAQLTVPCELDWANILFQLGCAEQAFRTYKEMLIIRKIGCERENLRMLESRREVGIIHHFEGQLDQAE